MGWVAASPAPAAWRDVAGETAERGAGGVLKKVWVVRNNAEVFEDEAADKVSARLRQHAKAYHYGEAGDGLIAIGDKSRKADCGHYGFIRKGDVIVWDTDQALRFVGRKGEVNVDLFRDEAMTDKIGEATVEGPNDPTVMPFPIFRKSDDARAYEIAFIYTAASGADTYDARIQESLRKVLTTDITSIDVAFVMDITGSMANELAEAKRKVREIMEEFSARQVDLFGRNQPLRLRFAFVGYRDKKEGERWLEVVPFASRGETDRFEERLATVEARSWQNDDWPENVCSGLEEALKLPWKKGSAKVIILIGDAAPLDNEVWPEVEEACAQQYIRIYAIPIGSHKETVEAFRRMTMKTGGQSFHIQDADPVQTVNRIIDALRIEEQGIRQAPEVVQSWAEQGATLSRDVQEFQFRGVIPADDRRPIPPTVYVSSKRDGTREVCLYKSKASLYEILGDMQTEFVGMIEDPSPELLAMVNAGAVELIAELDPKALQEIVQLDDFSRASQEIREMLSVMPELPGIVRELSEKGVAAEWHALARKTAVLSRFVSDPANFYEDHAWVPFEVLDFGSEDYIRRPTTEALARLRSPARQP